MPPHVLISNVGFGKASPFALEEIKKVASITENKSNQKYFEENFLQNIGNADILIAGTEKITRKVMQAAPKLKLIARVGAGTDNIDLAYAKERNLLITTTPSAPSEAVPEFTLALILNLLKNICLSDRNLHSKTWLRPMGQMLSSMKIGIVGLGKIGSKVATLINAISPTSEVLFYDPFVSEAFNNNVRKIDALDLLACQANIISLHLPLNTSTYRLIDAQFIAKMKKNSYLINTSRGHIVDEEALYRALKTEHLAGAALDVFETEPYQGRLTDLDNCILTSHISAMAKEVRQLMENQVAEDVIRFIQHQPLLRPLTLLSPVCH